MNLSILAPSLLIRSFAAVMLLSLAGNTSAAPLNVDQSASEVGVTFTQMSVAVDAQFTRFEVQADFDPANPADASATIIIDTASFDFGPGAEEYNAEVRKPEWFDTEKFPQARFDARGARPDGDKQFLVEGTLTIKGVQQAVSAPVTFAEADGQWVFSGTLPIKRLDYGLGATEWKDTSIVADQVTVRFSIVASKP
ncbi:MAG: YceI family protein [Burkholderiaceae bacterium]